MIGIVAINRLGVIGDQGRIPWASNAQDMQHFVAVTNEAQEIIVGRTTWEGLPKSVHLRLSGKVMVVTTDLYRPSNDAGVEWVSAHNCEHVRWNGFPAERPSCVIGGAQTYNLFKDAITTWHVTELDNSIEGDTTMPRYWEDLETFGLYQERTIDGGVIKTYRRWL